jgi:DNA mismatch repair protein MutS
VDDATPMMAQYLEIKAEHPDALLFYRMGDFYELFFEDAAAAAAALDIALTRRGMHQGRPIPMCGVPVRAAEGYLATLIRKGFRVAVAEQVEDPAEARRRGGRAPVARKVVRLVTPGTLTEEALLEPRRANRLAAIAEVRDEAALAVADISTGELRVLALPAVRIAPELSRLAPAEVLVSEAREAAWRAAVAETGAALTERPRAVFDSQGALRRLEALYGVAAVDGFGAFGRAEISALGAIVDYLELTQRGRLPLLRPPRREAAGAHMQIDAATRRNLEILASLSGGREGSLIAAIDRTVTAAGARLLADRLAAPLTDLGMIAARQAAVAHLVEDAGLRADLRAVLRRAPDLARALSRLALDRGGPRDLAAVRAALAAAEEAAALLGGEPPGELAAARAALAPPGDLAARLAAALVADPPQLARDGGFIAPGHDAELDAQRRLRDDGRSVIAALEAAYRERTGIAALKIRHNNVLGYFVETPDTHAARMLAPPLSDVFRHRQTTANLLRFTTAELSETESRILNAAGLALERELALFEGLRAAALAQAGALHGTAEALAVLDVAAALAEIAAEARWCRPVVTGDRAFRVAGGRHPAVERALRAEGAAFVANDCDLTPAAPDGAAIRLVTGPNMGGKSTYLRQNALIALLAQAGAFVPAETAEIGLVTQLFSRVGAADDLARGRSTFMVEMVETAAILNQAGPGALVILDEIGRGTATWDGLSIAWAVLEHLHDVNRCRGLFATHYHELTRLAGRLPGVANATVAVKEWEGEVIFLHEVRPGAADRSYGVQVARLAGLPPAVTERARAVLAALEGAGREGAGPAAVLDDLPLFAARPAAPPPAPVPPALAEIAARLAAAEPDAMTPREALELVYALRGLLPPAPP